MKDQLWVSGNKEAKQFLQDIGLTALVRLPDWGAVRFALMRRPGINYDALPGAAGTLRAGTTNLAWTRQDSVNLGGQYTNQKTIQVGAKIYVQIYEGDEIGAGADQCPFADFHRWVLRDLQIIARYKAGVALLSSIENAPSTGSVLIKFANGYNASSQVDGITCRPENFAPFSGAPNVVNGNVYVQYNPKLFGLPQMVGIDEPANARNRWGNPGEKPPDVTLFHEMVHADDIFNGIFDSNPVQRGRKADLKLSEMRCVGLDDYRSVKYSENAYRAQCGFARRDYYSDADNELNAPAHPIAQPASYDALLRHLGVRPDGKRPVSKANIVPRIRDHEILTWAVFKARSSARGRRNKVAPVDRAVKALGRKVAEIEQSWPDFHLWDVIGSDCDALTDLLETIVDTCDTYLADGDRQTSARLPAIRALRLAAIRQLSLYGIPGDKVLNHKPYLDTLPNKQIKDSSDIGQFGLAIERGNNNAVLDFLYREGFDYNIPHRGFKPVDWARMQGEVGKERNLAARPKLASKIADRINDGATVVDTLTAGTFLDPTLANHYNVRMGYLALWGSNGGMFRNVLRIAAKSMTSGARLQTVLGGGPRIPLRVYISDKCKSVCNAPNNVVTVLQYSDQSAIEGGLLHELTHFACHWVFDNTVLPFAGDGHAYIEAVAKDLKRAGFAAAVLFDGYTGNRAGFTGTAVDPAAQAFGAGIAANVMNADQFTGTNDQKLFVTLVTRLNTYLTGTLHNGVPMPILQESVVSIPQGLHCYGDRAKVNTIAPNLLAYYEGTFAPALNTFLVGRARAAPVVTRRRSLGGGASAPLLGGGTGGEAPRRGLIERRNSASPRRNPLLDGKP